MTYATTSDPSVHVERFGDGPGTYLTLRNPSDVPKTAVVTIRARALKLPGRLRGAKALLSRTWIPLSPPAPTRTLTGTLAPQSSQVLWLSRRVFLPIVLRP